MEKILNRNQLSRVPAGSSSGKKTAPESRKMPAWLWSLWSRDRLSLACLVLGLLSLALMLPGAGWGIWAALGCSIGGVAAGIMAAKKDGWNLSNRVGLTLSAVSLSVFIFAAALAGSIVAHLAELR